MIKVKCIENLATKHFNFRKDEIYEASKVNQNWWLIDAVGINAETFDKHFKKMDNEEKELKIATEQ